MSDEVTEDLPPEVTPAGTPEPAAEPPKPDHLATIAAYRANAEKAAAQALANHHLNAGAAQAYASVLNLLEG